MPEPGAPLPKPAVDPAVYTEGYYRAGCMGAEVWAGSEGRDLDGMFAGYAVAARIAPGEVLVDVGCGRGEMLVAALAAGAGRAIGVEYAPAAIELARRTLAAHGAEGRAEVHEADARALPVESGSADVVTFLDVVEHLAPTELDVALREARRVLRAGGRLLVHTMPNRSIYTITYRLQRLWHPGRRRSWPPDPRNERERAMHVNEMSVTRLHRALRRAGFTGVDVTLGDWMWTEFVPDERARITYHRLAAHRLTRRLGRGDLWGRAVAPG